MCSLWAGLDFSLLGFIWSGRCVSLASIMVLSKLTHAVPVLARVTLSFVLVGVRWLSPSLMSITCDLLVRCIL